MPLTGRRSRASRRIVRYVLGRVLWAVATLYLVVTAMFALLAFAPDFSNVGGMFSRAMAGEQVDPPSDPPPVHEQYVEWMWSLMTLRWGESGTAVGDPMEGTAGVGGGSNVDAVVEALPVTFAYVVPATLLAFLLALLLGYAAARRPRSRRDRLFSVVTYVAFSLPSFFIAAIAFLTIRARGPDWFPEEFGAGGAATVDNALWLALPGVVLTTHLLVGHFRYARAETRAALGEQYVTFVEAKGGGPLRVARHVFRNAAAPLVTLFVTELFGALLVGVFVLEVVFEVPGVGRLAYAAVMNRDVDLVMVLTALFATAVVFANLLQDLAYVALDPRAEG